MNAKAPPSLSVIVPVHNGGTKLVEALQGLAASDLAPELWELIVVDDASSDGSAEAAARHTDRIVRIDGAPRGPAFARNRGAEVARGEILAFVDADIVVHPDTLRRMLEVLSDAPEAVAVFGSYDTAPRARGLITEYRNLLHHRVHSAQPGDQDTFWAGLGAIRRGEFLRAGGFDERRYTRPQIEDIELGYRLRARGLRIVLDPRIQGTHLKRWTLRDVIVGDVFNRGVPWMHLLLEGRSVGAGTLNVVHSEKVLTALAVAGVAAVPLALVVGRGSILGIGVGLLLLVVAGNAPLLRWFSRVRSPWFAAAVVPLRLLYYVLNGFSAALAIFQNVASRIQGERRLTSSPPPLAVPEDSAGRDAPSGQRVE